MSSDMPAEADGRDRLISWSALGGSALAVFAWAACCVLPIALSVVGISIAGTALIAGQRVWLTLGAAAILAGGWWSVWRRRRACARDPSCAPPTQSTVALLVVATAMTAVALFWQPLIEPRALMALRGLQR